MKVLVTGATGLLGNTILRELHERGDKSIAHVRRNPDAKVFEGIDTELLNCDLMDQPLIDRAVQQCDAIIHSAGLIALGWTGMEQAIEVNQMSVRMLAESAIRHDRKLVLVGTVNTLAIGSEDEPSSETTPIGPENDQTPCVYVKTKRAGVAEIHKAVEKGLRASIVHPGFMLGPWDGKPSSGRMAIELVRQPVIYYPQGGCSVCDSRDVARTTVDVITAGADDGREYVLAGENWLYRKLWTEMAERLGRPIPRIPAGPMARLIGGVVGDLKTKLTGREGDVNSASLAMSRMLHFHDSSRAKAELGYTNRPIEDTLDEAIAWLKAEHLSGD